MLGTVVVGVIFTDIKGFPLNTYNPNGRNVGRVEYIHGGVSRNIAENIAASGMPVTFVSMTENGALGKEVVDRLDQRGVNTEFVLHTAANGIGKWMVILNENGDVAGEISCPPDMKPLSEFIDSYGSVFVRDAEQIVLEVDIGEETAEKVIALAEKHGKKVYPIVGNLHVLKKRQDLISRTSCFICNQHEIGQLFGDDYSRFTPDDLLPVLIQEVNARNYPSTVVTMGDKGCIFYDKENGCWGSVPAIPTKLVDSTGAGDAFLSGTVIGLSNGLVLREAIDIGTRLASLTIGSGESSCPENEIAKNYFCEKEAAKKRA